MLKRAIKLILLAGLLFMPVVVQGLLLDQPHHPQGSTAVNCGNCHWTTGGTPPWSGQTKPSGWSDADWSLNNQRCWVCHNTSSTIPANIHSATTTSTQYWSGQWTTECISCHNPHYQRQARAWKTDPDLYLATGAFTSTGVGTYDSVNNRTPITLSSPLTTEYQDMYFIPDKNYPFFYKIISSTLNQSTFYVRGQVNTTYVRGSGYAIIYGKNIKDYITYTNPGGQQLTASIKLFRPGLNVQGGFIDSNNYSTSLCQACHTKTANFTTTNPNHSTAINEGASCLNPASGCHQEHPQGFQIAGAKCGVCHGVPPSYYNSSTDHNLVKRIRVNGTEYDTYTGVTTPGAHVKHSQTSAMTYSKRQVNCMECHNGGMQPAETDPTIGDYKIQIGINATTVGYTGGNYDGRTSLANTFTYQAVAPTTVTTGGTLVCSNIYCHGSTIGGTVNPVWTGTVTCGDCHKATAANPPTLGSHVKHAGDSSTVQSAIACSMCHGHSGTGSSAHVDGSAQWNLNTGDPRIGSSATYRASNAGSVNPVPSSTYGQCSNLYCHSNANPLGGTNQFSTVTWGGAAMACNSCHSGAGDASPTWSVSHTKHVNTYSANANFTCNACHSAVASGNTTISDKTLHVNANKDVAFNAFNPSALPYDNVNHQCSNLYCHSNAAPLGGTNVYVTALWNTSLDCGGCHRKADTSTNMTAAGSTGLMSSAHVKHVALDQYGDPSRSTKQITCQTCHNTVASGNSTISNYANHVNATKNIGFDTSWIGGTPSYSGSPNYQCSSVYCHSDGQPLGQASPTYKIVAWTAGALTCNDCHESIPPTNAHPKHTNASTYNMGCVECHQSVVSDNSTISSKVLHVNNVKDVAWKTGGYNADGGAYASPNCTNIYCHSQGTENTAPYTTPNVTAAWNTTLDCKGCHDFNAAATPDIMSTGSHARHVNNASIMGVNFTCSECHNQTVSSGDSPVTNFALHVNKQVNIAFNTTLNSGASYAGSPAPMQKAPGSAYGQCTNLYCHSSGNTARSATPEYKTPSWGSTFTNDCDQCHGDAAGKSHPVYASGAPGSSTANSHIQHVENASIGCQSCHYTTTTNGTTIVSGGGQHLNKQEDVSFIASIGGTYNADTSCSSTYCHGAASPQWGATGTLNCGSCHQSMGAGGTATYNGAHLKHSGIASGGYNFSCEECHAVNGTIHAGGPVDPTKQAAEIVFTNGTGTGAYRGSAETNYKYYTMYTNPYTGAGVTPSAYVPGTTIQQDTTNTNLKWTSEGTCNNLWCHSNANPYGGTNTYVSVQWGGTVNCGSCHASTGNSAPHTKHVSTYPYTCNHCHSATASDNTTISNKAEHVDAQKDIVFNTWVGSATWSAASHQCSNTYCHSDGTSFAAPAHAGLLWSGTMSCTSCHGNPPSYTSGSPKANSHVEHVNNNGASCYNCHAATVNSAGAIANFSNHVNKSYDLLGGGTFAGNPVSFTYTYGSPSTCSNISCHGGTGATWGASTPCQDCHMLNQADVDDFSWLNGTKAVISQSEWLSSGHGRTAGTYPASGNSAANFEAAAPQQCLYCHDNAVLHGTSNYFRLRNINDAQWGMNGVCKGCHATGSTGITVNGVLKNSTRKIDSRHYGTKHAPSNNGGQFCWDCHDPHGDSNIYMVHASVAKTSSATDGKPTTTVATVFTNNSTGTDYAKSAAPFDGICNVCHTTTNHYTSTSGDGHNSGTRCTSCHPHTGPDYNSAFSPSGGESSGGTACDACHSDLYNRMHDSTLYGSNLMVYKHYMNNAGTGYPTSATLGASTDTNRKCLICHVDHDIFRPDINPNATRSKNLRSDISTLPTTTSGFSESDYDATTGGICLSCHVNQQTKAFTTPNNVSTVPPIPYSGLTLAQATQVVKNSTHNYAAPSGAFKDTSTFKAVCLKCHNDTLNPKSSMNAQSADPKFGLHQSGRNSFFAVMGSGNFKDFVSGTITAVSGTTITVNQDLTKDYKGFAFVVTKANGTQSQRAIIIATDTSLEQVTVAAWPAFTPSVNDYFEITKDITPIEEVCFNCHSQGSNSGGSGIDKPNSYKTNDGFDFYNVEPMQNRLEQMFNLFNADSGRVRDAISNVTTGTLCTNNTLAANELVNYYFRAGSVVRKVTANTATASDTTCQTNYGLSNSYSITLASRATVAAGVSYKVSKPASHPLDNLGLHKPDEHLTAVAGWNIGDTGGSCTAVTANSCTDSSKRWVGSFANMTITFTSGACAGQTFTISSNTANTITLSTTPGCTLAIDDTYYIGSRHVSCADCHNTHAAQVNPSGTVSSVSNTPPSAIYIKDTEKTLDKTGWANDKWKGYLIMVVKSTGFRQIRQITSSVTDATGTTYYVGLIWNSTNLPAAGDKYEVFKQDGSAGSGQKGVWGVTVGHLAPNTTNTNDNYRPGVDYTYTKTYDAQYERDVCMKCHSYYGFLAAPPTTPSLFGTVNTIMPASDIAEEANPNNLAHHAIYARGKNQPITATGSTTATGRPYGANPNWPKYTTGTISISTAGTATLGGSGLLPQNVLPGWMVYVGSTNYPTAGSANTPRNWFEIIEIYNSTSFKVTPAPSTALNNQTYAITAGLGNTFVPPYGPWAILRCKDCHGSILSDPLGPHASINKFLVRSIEPVIGYEFFNGTSVVITTETQNTGTVLNNNYFCFNCHRRNVYGDQVLISPAGDIYSRVRHGNVDAGGLYKVDNRVANPTWVGTGIHCNQCHAGYRGTGAPGTERVGGIHGTNFYSKNAQGTSMVTWTTKQGKRFLNGASWAIGSGDTNTAGGIARPTTTTSGGCYVRKTADSMNKCTQGHTADRTYGGATYDYDNP